MLAWLLPRWDLKQRMQSMSWGNVLPWQWNGKRHWLHKKRLLSQRLNLTQKVPYWNICWRWHKILFTLSRWQVLLALSQRIILSGLVKISWGPQRIGKWLQLLEGLCLPKRSSLSWAYLKWLWTNSARHCDFLDLQWTRNQRIHFRQCRRTYSMSSRYVLA